MRALSALTALAVLFVLAPPDRAVADESRVYVRTVPDRATFDKYSRIIGSDRLGKFIIDIQSNDIYFIDVNVFKLHADFVLGVLLEQEWTADNIRAYNKNYERSKPRFILGYLTEHLKVNKLTFAFWEGDKIDARGVQRVHKKLAKTFFVKDLAFRPDSPAQEKVAKAVRRKGIKTITNDEIYRAADYQSFNHGQVVGTLRIVPKGTPYESLMFDRNDIVILQESYPDISPVSGIMSSVFSTPLAHVNLRATAWGIPNAGYARAFEDYASLDGKAVFFAVEDTTHTLRIATRQEIDEYEHRVRTQKTVVIPPADLETANMPMLTKIHADQGDVFGAKTANLGEIASAGLPRVNVPEGFGVPFFYYVRHIRKHGVDNKIEAMLSDERFETDGAWRRSSLETLRKEIVAAPLDKQVANAIYKRVKLQLGGRGVFVRSSTNAEDLEGFNGAGLYDTVPNVRGKKNIENAVKQVWASLWNFRAVEERSMFGIDHKKVYPGVLIQVGVNATAAGVLITTNLFNPEDGDSFTINAKAGLGIRVVEGTRVPEQVIFDLSNDGTKIISRSDDPVMLVFDQNGGIKEVPNPHNGVILTEERAKRLAVTVDSFIPLLSQKHPLDVEWVFEDEKVWIVQARPYVTSR